ncbi:MAG: hypothetical protein WD250_17055 [Egibacteraceae bacterium]
MLTDVGTTAGHLLDRAREDSAQLLDDIEWLAHHIQAGPHDPAGKHLYTDGRLDPGTLARMIRHLACSVTAPRLLSGDEALAPHGVTPLGEAADLGFIVNGHVDRAEALRRARKVACLADLLSGPRHDQQHLQAQHAHAVFLTAGADSDYAWLMHIVEPTDPHAIPVTQVRW